MHSHISASLDLGFYVFVLLTRASLFVLGIVLCVSSHGQVNRIHCCVIGCLEWPFLKSPLLVTLHSWNALLINWYSVFLKYFLFHSLYTSNKQERCLFSCDRGGRRLWASFSTMRGMQRQCTSTKSRAQSMLRWDWVLVSGTGLSGVLVMPTT